MKLLAAVALFAAVHLIAMVADAIRELVIPDYVQNALGRVNATGVDFACGSTPDRWEGFHG